MWVDILIVLPIVACVSSTMFHMMEGYLLEGLALRPTL